MKRLTILHDDRCAFCRRCVEWLRGQPKYLDFEFLPLESELTRERFPELRRSILGGELTVIDDEGGVYYGNDAYIICLYGLREYRAISARLSHPAVRPFVRRALNSVTQHRHTLSELFERV
ncbi:MAG: DUF393 domain-containing protein [Ignavibacteriae bacterium]|nr:DUF393 domain-containing protein [Ignavibacteriota bacterium]MCB9215158.1 DUF393 domain-containing protein [Ignavibacteria bacterium]